MHRTIDDYDAMTKREIIKAKQEKAQMRVQKFRTDYTELRTQFERLKAESSAEAQESNRAELISGASPLSPSDTRRRFQHTGPTNSTLHPGLRPQAEPVSESPFRGSTPQPYGGMGDREFRALDEHSFIQNTDSRLDDFIAQGREVLDNLVDQRNMLKGTQRRLLDAANTLGLSRDVIGWIERRRPPPDTPFNNSVFAVINDISNSLASIPDALHTPSDFDPLKLATELSEKGIDFAKSKLDEVTASLPEAQEKLEEFKVAIDDLVNSAQSFQGIVQKHCDEKGFRLEEIAALVATEVEKILEDLKAEFNEPLPEDQDEWYRELDIKVSNVLDWIEHAVVEVAKTLDISESESREAFRVIKPHIKRFILTSANLTRRHPILTAIVVGISAQLIFRPLASAMVALILNIIGFGPQGPIKGSLASLVQKNVFGPAIPPGSWFGVLQSLAMKL
ncbi:hypothetical protein NLJ89_g7843 [Agrocybe chaxingu]|uniref:Uncharacterized protein n=1 Tax=Agrocybe chaxingu TaxID=84603 RepID=A0A9W8JVK2_9AGAR|nr:hypothetical protein NLJ89_g7843 [Agrocybe chaxingu]